MLSKKKNKKTALRWVGAAWLKCFHLQVVPDVVRTKWCGPGMQSSGGRAASHRRCVSDNGSQSQFEKACLHFPVLIFNWRNKGNMSLALSQDCIQWRLWALQGRGLLKVFTLWTLSTSVCSFQIQRKPWLFDQHVLKLANIGSITVIC